MRLTFDDLLKMDALIIPGTWAAQAMGMDSGKFMFYARNGQLPFEAMVSGNRVKVARIPFLKFWGLTDEEIKNKIRRQ